MRRTIRPLLVPAAALCVVMGLGMSPAHAGSCKEVHADFSSYLNPDGSADGTIHGNHGLSGTTHFVGTAPFTPVSPYAVSYAGLLTIETPSGSLSTDGAGVFTPVPGGSGAQFDTVVGGTGDFQGATGTLYFNFTVRSDFSGFDAQVSGTICFD